MFGLWLGIRTERLAAGSASSVEVRGLADAVTGTNGRIGVVFQGAPRTQQCVACGAKEDTEMSATSGALALRVVMCLRCGPLVDRSLAE